MLEKIDDCGTEAQERLNDEHYLALVRQGFKTWNDANTESKKEYVRRTLTNAATTKLCSDDLIRLFLQWIENCDETHIKVIRIRRIRRLLKYSLQSYKWCPRLHFRLQKFDPRHYQYNTHDCLDSHRVSLSLNHSVMYRFHDPQTVRHYLRRPVGHRHLLNQTADHFRQDHKSHRLNWYPLNRYLVPRGFYGRFLVCL
jgi:hypothetical protein